MSEEWIDGIPPVGCECLAMGVDEALVIGYDGEFVICKVEGFLGDVKYRSYHPSNLSPIQTQADKEREDAIEAMYDSAMGSTGCNDTCIELYDAGYRLAIEQGEVVSGGTFLAEWLVSSQSEMDVFINQNFIITRKSNA